MPSKCESSVRGKFFDGVFSLFTFFFLWVVVSIYWLGDKGEIREIKKVIDHQLLMESFFGCAFSAVLI